MVVLTTVHQICYYHNRNKIPMQESEDHNWTGFHRLIKRKTRTWNTYPFTGRGRP
jgi:hypothetical protein